MPFKPAMRGKKTYRRYSKKKVVKVTQKVRVPTFRPTQKAGIAEIVKQYIGRRTENKAVGNVVENDVAHNSSIGSADCEPIIAPIGQLDTTVGFSSATQRIGDRITPKSLTVKGVISLEPSLLNTTQTLYARVLILAQKDIKVGSQVLGGAVNTSALLRPMFNTVAGNDQIPFSGNTENLLHPVNTDLFRVYYDRIHKICGTGDGGIEENPARSYMWSYRFRQLPASLTFDEGNGDYPNNFAPFVAIGYAYADGTPPDTVNTRLVSHVYSLLTFEDA